VRVRARIRYGLLDLLLLPYHTPESGETLHSKKAPELLRTPVM